MSKDERGRPNKVETITATKKFTIGGAFEVTVGGGLVTPMTGAQFENAG